MALAPVHSTALQAPPFSTHLAPKPLNFLGRWVQIHHEQTGLLGKIVRLILWFWPSLKAQLALKNRLSNSLTQVAQVSANANQALASRVEASVKLLSPACSSRLINVITDGLNPSENAEQPTLPLEPLSPLATASSTTVALSTSQQALPLKPLSPLAVLTPSFTPVHSTGLPAQEAHSSPAKALSNIGTHSIREEPTSHNGPSSASSQSTEGAVLPLLRKTTAPDTSCDPDAFDLSSINAVWYVALLSKASNPTENWLIGLPLEQRILALIRKKSRDLASTHPVPFFNLATLFPERKLTKNHVHRLTIEKLLALPAALFFPIIDLLSAEQVRAVLISGASLDRKMALYFYSQTLANLIDQQQLALWNQPIDSEVRLEAAAFYSQATQYKPSAFEQVLDQTSLLKAMKAASGTLSLDLAPYKYLPPERRRMELEKYAFMTNAFQDQEKWESALRAYLPHPDLDSIDIRWIKAKRAKLVALYETLEENIRKPGTYLEEVNCNLDRFHSPGRIVEAQLEAYCLWLKEEMIQCKSSLACPIITAALAYMRFISIHPFRDGNGRTGRFIADSILRTFQLLPGVWDTDKAAIFPFGSLATQTPTTVVQSMLRALKSAYEIVQKAPQKSQAAAIEV